MRSVACGGNKEELMMMMMNDDETEMKLDDDEEKTIMTTRLEEELMDGDDIGSPYELYLGPPRSSGVFSFLTESC